MIGIEGAAGEYAAQRLRVCPGSSIPDPDIGASIPTGLPPRSGALVISWRLFGTCF